MVSKELHQARAYETAHISQIPESRRPAFHVTGGIGWINDPNGFSCFRGQYHLFYQYHPYDTHWGPMHWGHVKTRDFIRWERLPIALAPDQDYDRFGCFSGSAVETPEGNHMILYTGVQKLLREDGSFQELQTQCIAVGDGVTYKKLPSNPVLTGADLPEGGSEKDFRDPKLWYDPKDSCYYCVVGNRTPDGSGAVLLFRSDNGRAWQYVTTLDASQNQLGRMWECPDFFPLEGAHILFVSPQEMKRAGHEFHVGNGTVCILGQYRKDTHTFQRRHLHAIDYGLDFYAPQTLETPDGRRIMIGWMQSWASCHSQPENTGWFGQMTLPRELFIRNGRLHQLPVRELKNYQKNPVVYRNVSIKRETALEGIRGRMIDLCITVRPGTDGGYRKFTLSVAKGTDFVTRVCFDPAAGLVSLDRTDSGFREDIVHTRTFPVHTDGELTVRAVLDRWSLELFFQDGAVAASATLYTPQECDGICFDAQGHAMIDVEKYDIAVAPL